MSTRVNCSYVAFGFSESAMIASTAVLIKQKYEVNLYHMPLPVLHSLLFQCTRDI